MTRGEADALKAKREATLDAVIGMVQRDPAEVDRFKALKRALVADTREPVCETILETLR